MGGQAFGERASEIEDLVMELERQPTTAPLFDLIFRPAAPAVLRGAAQ